MPLSLQQLSGRDGEANLRNAQVGWVHARRS